METSTEGGYEDALTEVAGRAEDLPPSLARVSFKARTPIVRGWSLGSRVAI